jgi:hypothetical protein
MERKLMELPKCDKCGRDVQLKDGVFSISFKEIRQVQEAEEQFKKRHTSPLLHVSEVMAFPGRVPWVWHHYGCNMNGSSYEIEADRFNTISKAMGWTLHLMGKNWFEFTNWRNVIERFYPECC